MAVGWRGWPRRLVPALLRPYWRLTRGLTLGAQGVVVDGNGRVLLVRHGYRPGWFFPGGGVERHETVVMALARELAEEAGIVLEDEPVLHGLFANGERFAGDHIAVFLVRAWRQTHVPAPGLEIAEQAFFPLDALPEAIDAGTRRRLGELFEGRPRGAQW